LGQQWGYGWCQDRAALEVVIERELEIALGLDPNDSDVHRILAALGVVRNDLGKAMFHQQRALALNPNDDLIVVQHGEVLTWLGQAEEGIEWIRKAMRLNPYHPARFWAHLGRAYFVARRYAEAADAVLHISTLDAFHLASLAACYAQMGDAAAAATYARNALAHKPDFSIQRDYLPALHYKRESDLAHHREA